MSDIWEELDNQFVLPKREKDDIDCDQFMKHYRVSQNTALRMMKKLVSTGEYVYIIVRDDNSGTLRRKIIRKVAK